MTRSRYLERILTSNQRIAIQYYGIDWQWDAKCDDPSIDPETFFHIEGFRTVENIRENIRRTKEAKKICNECPVKDICRDFAIVSQERYGIWGGMTLAERNRFRQRAIANV